MDKIQEYEESCYGVHCEKAINKVLGKDLRQYYCKKWNEIVLTALRNIFCISVCSFISYPTKHQMHIILSTPCSRMTKNFIIKCFFIFGGEGCVN